MNQYDPDIHHRRTVRFHEFDYSEQGLYFVTICVHEQRPLFGKIVDGKMQLNFCGKIANKYWTSITSHFTNTVLHEFVIMPNHMHGIIEITATAAELFNRNAKNQDTVITSCGFAGKTNPMSSANLARIVRWYKGRTTFECRKKQFVFAWQRNYYEHIVRNDDDYLRIVEYITDNPAIWDEDRFYNVENTYNAVMAR